MMYAFSRGDPPLGPFRRCAHSSNSRFFLSKFSLFFLVYCLHDRLAAVVWMVVPEAAWAPENRTLHQNQSFHFGVVPRRLSQIRRRSGPFDVSAAEWRRSMRRGYLENRQITRFEGLAWPDNASLTHFLPLPAETARSILLYGRWFSDPLTPTVLNFAKKMPGTSHNVARPTPGIDFDPLFTAPSFRPGFSYARSPTPGGGRLPWAPEGGQRAPSRRLAGLDCRSESETAVTNGNGFWPS